MGAALDRWDSFYVIVGSAAGALIGLQFVVMTLLAERPSASVQEVGQAFATPTIVHFSVVLFLSAILRAPWDGVRLPALILGLAGVGGLVYALVTAWRIRLQPAYKPDFEDWAFHVLLPLTAYAGIAGSAVFVPAHLREALFGVGAAVLLLLFDGIHNAWDAVGYQVLLSLRQQKKKVDREIGGGSILFVQSLSLYLERPSSDDPSHELSANLSQHRFALL